MIKKLTDALLLPKAIFLMGPTASGKSRLAIALSKQLPVELISVDSSLIYRDMDIGTAKPTAQELAITPHRLLNILDPSEVYSVAQFRRDALTAMADISRKGKIPLLVGGTMMYYKSLLEGLSPLPSANTEIRQCIKEMVDKKGLKNIHNLLSTIDPIAGYRIHPNDFQRISRALEVFFISKKTLTELTKESSSILPLPYDVYQFAISIQKRELIYQRIEQRFYKMIELGLEAEVRSLFQRGDLHADMPSMRSINYRQMWSFLSGNIDYNQMVYRVITSTKQLAKRQLTWLRSWKNIYWLEFEQLDLAVDKIDRILNKNKQ